MLSLGSICEHGVPFPPLLLYTPIELLARPGAVFVPVDVSFMTGSVELILHEFDAVVSDWVVPPNWKSRRVTPEVQPHFVRCRAAAGDPDHHAGGRSRQHEGTKDPEPLACKHCRLPNAQRDEADSKREMAQPSKRKTRKHGAIQAVNIIQKY